ncbi:hypothetical protein RSOLAG22IIIB_11279 [Rhizoctonia solani]|uniref:Peptidase C14 caspase domain-containing protein n=1 Tax=Rhizoctonia solani TaxID=456999 RepID=A0A0K6G853_9AGAM|nr:hypothetical protein RSOLAG22IIIB_11279 [Rhizoctonia solani]
MSAPMSMEAVIQAIKSAMQTGDRVPNQASTGVYVKRRALVIVAQYHRAGYMDSPVPLWNTPADGVDVYRMLRHLGYEAQNIRVLCDLEDSQSPTRENITASLHWLVENTKEGDFRFLHFSGHDGLIESKGEGKEVREFKFPFQAKGCTPSMEAQAWPSQPLSGQEVPRGELKYFNEAIIPSWGSDNWFRAQSQNSICGREMNDILRILHPGSTLTMTFDCCYGRRVLDNRLKLSGGLRGSVEVDSSGYVDIPTSSLLMVPETQDDSASVPTSSHLNDGTLPSNVGDQPTSTVPDMIVISEKSPENEKKMEIRAKTLSWGAWHQSQAARDYKDWGGGFFTRAFTALVIAATKDTTIREVYTRTDNMIKNISFQSNEQVPHYFQLWASGDHISEGDEEALGNKLLDSPIIGNI